MAFEEDALKMRLIANINLTFALHFKKESSGLMVYP